MTTAPRTLPEVKAIKDPLERIIALNLYLERLRTFQAEAIRVRDEALRQMPGGPTEVSRQTGLSVSTIKLARRAR